jgi:hypothetical protein
VVVADLLPATFAALGAVIGVIFGAILGRSVGFAAFSVTSSELFDVISVTVGGLGGAVLCAWLGLRLSDRFLSRNAKPS